MAIDDNTSYELTGYQVKDLAGRIRLKADASAIPTVNDATLTLVQNGTTVGTFTANQSTNTTVNLAGGIYADDPTAPANPDAWITPSDIDWSGIPELIGTYAADGDKNYALKYPDGTLVCCISKTLANRQFTSWGSIYGNDIAATSIGYFAAEFKYTPTCTVSCYAPGSTVIVGTQGQCTKTLAPGMTACRATSATLTLYIHVVAIGRWK